MTVNHALPGLLWLAAAIAFHGVCMLAAAMLRLASREPRR